MRILGRLLAVSLFLGMGVPMATAEEPAAPNAKPDAVAVAKVDVKAEIRPDATPIRQFSVECGFIGSGISAIKPPVFSVKEGETKSVPDVVQQTIVLGETPGKADKRIKRELAEGITIEATVDGAEGDKAVLDVSFEMSSNCIRGIAKPGQTRWVTERYRVLECISLGKRIVADFDDFGIEILVSVIPESPSVAAK